MSKDPWDAREEQRRRKLEQFQREENAREEQYQKDIKKCNSELNWALFICWLPFLAFFILSYFNLSPLSVPSRIQLTISFFMLIFAPTCYSHLLFVKQIDKAFERMELAIPTKRQIYYPIGFFGIDGGSSLWHAIRSSAIYQFRKKGDRYFDILDSSYPSSCAWAAAWFYANHYLSTVESLCACPSEPDDIFSREIPPLELELLEFVLRLGDYGFQHSFISHTSWCEAYGRLFARYSIVSRHSGQTAVMDILNCVSSPDF